MNLVFLGLSITSTWGNGHATTYRGLLRELAKRGHKIAFLERNAPWYADNREFDSLPYCDIAIYRSLNELKDTWPHLIEDADAVVVGSYVPDGIAIGEWVLATARNLTAFYDIDTPVTLANVAAGTCSYISPALYPRYGLYLSFTGGPILQFIENELGSPCARPLYCSVDPDVYFPEQQPLKWDLAYLGTYSPDRQPALTSLLIDAAIASPERQFAVAGPQYPESIAWPQNVERIQHLPARDHRAFYNSQCFALNITRQDMVRAGYSPSVRLFEAAACGIPILTDVWPGLNEFFMPEFEIIPVLNTAQVTSNMQMPEDRRLQIAGRARSRTLQFHTAAVRAREFETHVNAALS